MGKIEWYRQEKGIKYQTMPKRLWERANMDFEKIIGLSLIAAAMCVEASVSAAAPMPTSQSFTNSLGMKSNCPPDWQMRVS
ncbi:MAG: hypothetical protein ACYTBJ_24985 [Planctomycetota bacterium]